MPDPISITAVSTIIGIGIGVLGSVRAGKKDIKEDITQSVTQNVKLETKLDNIAWGVDSIRIDMKEHGRKIDDINDRLARCEESTKSSHKRIDEHLQLSEMKEGGI